MVNVGSVGCTATLWNCVAFSPGVLRLSHVAPVSSERHTPPSLPNHTVLPPGAHVMAWTSPCRPVSCAAENDVPSKLSLSTAAARLSALPPMKIVLVETGETATARSYQHWPPQKPVAPEMGKPKDAPWSVLVRSNPVLSSVVIAI